MKNPEIGALVLEEGMECSFDETLQYLNEAGYIRVSSPNKEGYYSVTGGIIEVNPFGSKESITLDFFGDQIETIKVKNDNRALSIIRIKPYSI